ncbi:hypothetical protein Tco_1335144 [Tanacetum coccineum]
MGGQTSSRNYQYLGSPQEGLYPKAWERYNDLLYKGPTHDINSHQKKWHDGSTIRNIESSSSNDGLAALMNKLDNLGRDMKKLKESVYGIQDGCKICKGPHLDKECPFNEEVKQVGEVRYGEFGRTMPFNRNNEGRQTLTETKKKIQNHHNEIIQGLKSRVTTLAKEAVTKIDNNEDCKAIFTNDGAPLYTPFYYSPEEIEYFSANSGFSDDDELNNVTSIPDEDLKQTTPKQTTTHYVEPYIPPIPFPKRLEQHAEEALIHKTMESLKKIKSNRPFLKEIRQSDEYPKFMKDLVANKPLTIENEDIRINHRCSALLLNQLPPKEKDPRIFIPPCSIGRMPIILGRPLLTTAHAKIDVFKKSISLEVGNEKVIFKLRNNLHDMKSESVLMIQSNIIAEEDELMNIEYDLFTYNTNTCESCHILAVDTDLFTYEIITQETYDEIAHKCCLNTQDVIGEKSRTILGKKKSHWKQFGVDYDDSNEFNDPDQCVESINNEIRERERVINNLHDEWFKGTSDDEDDIEGIIDYLEPTSYDGFINLDEEEYNKR